MTDPTPPSGAEYASDDPFYDDIQTPSEAENAALRQEAGRLRVAEFDLVNLCARLEARVAQLEDRNRVLALSALKMQQERDLLMTQSSESR